MSEEQKKKATNKVTDFNLLKLKNSELENKISLLKQLQQGNPTSLNVEEIIHITVRVGTGESDDPIRDIHKLWTEDGKFIVSLEDYPI